MIWFKYLLIIGLFIVFSILQMSLIQNIEIMGQTLNIIFILFFVLTFFEGKNTYDLGFFGLITAGILLDMFSGFYFGVSLIVLLIIYSTIKISSYFLKDRSDNVSPLQFSIVFALSFIAYQWLLSGASLIFKAPFSFAITFGTAIALIYNLAFALVGFFIYQKFMQQHQNPNQLKLF